MAAVCNVGMTETSATAVAARMGRTTDDLMSAFDKQTKITDPIIFF